tara:strand:+ start:2738 stop:3193 length:456 start_codon:yes stop_codon:yes gene_type:complete
MIIRGTAYGFFDCEAPKERIKELLPDISSDVNTPSDMELSLEEGIEGIKGNSELMTCYNNVRSNIIFPSGMDISKRIEIRKRIATDVRYVMEANLVGVTNEAAANELNDILNCISHMSDLYEGAFRGAVVYKDDGNCTPEEQALYNLILFN